MSIKESIETLIEQQRKKAIAERFGLPTDAAHLHITEKRVHVQTVKMFGEREMKEITVLCVLARNFPFESSTTITTVFLIKSYLRTANFTDKRLL